MHLQMMYSSQIHRHITVTVIIITRKTFRPFKYQNVFWVVYCTVSRVISSITVMICGKYSKANLQNQQVEVDTRLITCGMKLQLDVYHVL